MIFAFDYLYSYNLPELRRDSNVKRYFTLIIFVNDFQGVLQNDDKTVTTSGIDSPEDSPTDFNKNSLKNDQHNNSEEEEKESIEQIRKRRTSIDALDLQVVNEAIQPKRKVSQIDNLRHKFQEYHREVHRKTSSTIAAVDESAISGEGPKKRKVSQIDRFRSKFLAYANNGGKGETSSTLNTLIEKGPDNNSESTTMTKCPPSRAESSDGEDLPRFSSSPPSHLRSDNKNNDNGSPQDSETVQIQNRKVHKISHQPQLTLATVLQYSKLVTATLNREPGEGWGIELVHVTKTGSSMGQNDKGEKDEEKVVYVRHNGNGQNSIINTTPTTDSSVDLFTPSGNSSPRSPSSSESSEHEIATILGTTFRSSVDMDKSVDDMRHIVHKQNLRRRMGVTQPPGSSNHNLAPADASPILSRPGSATHVRATNPLPQRPSSALAQWRKDGSPQPRPGVRIVALTEGGVAAESGELAVDDIIVEVSKRTR